MAPATPVLAGGSPAPAAQQAVTRPEARASGADGTFDGSVGADPVGPGAGAHHRGRWEDHRRDALQYPNGNCRDQQINAYALPILAQEALAAQSADIDTVSGATVTSDGYIDSLQAALDQAHL